MYTGSLQVKKGWEQILFLTAFLNLNISHNLYIQVDFPLLKMADGVVPSWASEVLKLHDAFRNHWKLLKTDYIQRFLKALHGFSASSTWERRIPFTIFSNRQPFSTYRYKWSISQTLLTQGLLVVCCLICLGVESPGDILEWCKWS